MAITFFNWTSGTGGDYLLNLAFLYHQRNEKKKDPNFKFTGFAMGNNQWTAPFNMIELSTQEDWISSRFIHVFKMEWCLPWEEIAEEANMINRHLLVQTHGLNSIINSTVVNEDRYVIYNNTTNLFVNDENKPFVCDMIHAKAIEEERAETDEWVEEDNKETIHSKSRNHEWGEVFLSEDTSSYHSLLSELGVDINDEELVLKLNESRRLYNMANKILKEIYDKSISQKKTKQLLASKERRYSFDNMNNLLLKQEHLLYDLTKWNES